MVRVKEIFSSIQGEGPYVGYKQLFIRFCGCNLNCSYCDTDFEQEDSEEYSLDDILKIIEDNSDCHSLSLTGGEPLLQKDFIKELGKTAKLPLYLETNGTLYENLEEVIDYIDYISMDIKLPSSTSLPPMWDKHEKFIKSSLKKDLFVKVVFDKNITDFEIHKITDLCEKYNIELILQPMMQGKILSIDSEFMTNILNKCLKKYKKVRLIPQVHKFIDVI
jgi:organic radical activating enzyme